MAEINKIRVGSTDYDIHATYADTATKATKDASGNTITSTYETKTDAATKLAEAKTYTDTKTSNLATTKVVDNKVSAHNSSTSAHNDIRNLITQLTTRLNTLADSDDTTLDQMSEIVAYIKANKSLIDSVTTNKINVSDIVNNLTTNVTSKPLSAAQGVVLKGLIDALSAVVEGKAPASHTHTITADASDDDVIILAGTKGTNKVTYSASHANSGVTAGTYKSVTVNAKGHVTGGSNPTTVSEYGITDAYTKTQIDDTVDSLNTAINGKAPSSHIHTASDITAGVISKDRLPEASGSSAGITIVYPAANCTTFSSDSGTITPLAAQKAAKMFAITRPGSSTNKAIVRYSNTSGDVQNSKIIIEDVTNTRDSTKKAQVISIPAEDGKKMVYGYCTDQVDGTSFIGGVFDANATSYPYASGLAIGGTSGNLLWKGSRVITSNGEGATGTWGIGISGNAATATEFVSTTTVSATGDATGTSAASKKGWSIPLTLANSGVTAGSYGPSANASPAHGKTFSVPYLTVDAKGRVTAASTKTITLPAAPTLSGGTGATNDATVVGGVTVNGHAVTVGKKTLTAGSNVTITPGTTSITIAAKDTTYTSLKNPHSLTVKGNGTQSFTYDGSAAKTLNIKAGSNVSISSDTSGNVTINATDTTYSTATSSTLGLVKIGYTQSGKNYPVQLSSGQMYVNVPWTDNNTVTTIASTTGGGNAVTAISASNGALTVTKGDTFVNLSSAQTITGVKTFSNDGFKLGGAKFTFNSSTKTVVLTFD